MAVRKRQWRTPNGAIREAWIAEYADGNGVRRARQFARKKDADTFYAQANVAVQKGIHTVASTSPTVASAAADWLRYIELEGRERATLAH